VYGHSPTSRADVPGQRSSVVVHAQVRSTDVTGRVSPTHRTQTRSSPETSGAACEATMPIVAGSKCPQVDLANGDPYRLGAGTGINQARPEPGLSQFPSRVRPAMIVAMTDGTTTFTLPEDAPTAVELRIAVHGGDVDLVRRLLSENPDLAKARFGTGGGTRTALHFVSDWPGYFPNGPDIVKLLIDAGADPNAATTPAPSETPLHWAASSDDVDVAVALIDGGADLETPGGSIGTPLANAVGYGCWQVARLLVSRGALIGSLWEAAALGDRSKVDEFLKSDPPPTDADIDHAFWQACHGGQRRMAEHLLAQGADINTTPDHSDKTALQIAGHADTTRQALVDWLQAHGATPS
jgi:uncharacterized protein